MKSGGRNRAIMLGLCGVALLFAETARGASASEFVGNWVNINSRTTGLTRVDIGVVKFNFLLHAWKSCVPTDCDLGTVTTPIPLPLGDTFTVVSDLPAVTTTLRITLIGPNSLYIHTRVDSLGNRTDYDDYFYRDGGRVLPDLIVSGLSIPKPVVVYGALPRMDVTMTIKNIGPGILPAGTVQAALSGRTRNGASFTSSGYFSIVTTEPLYPGQTITRTFAVGHDSGWPVGCYSMRVLVDSNQGVDEANEKNNLSPVLSFDVANERFLAGTIEYGGQPLTNYTTVPSSRDWIRDSVSGEYPYDYFFWYNPQTGHYLFSGLPDSYLYLAIYFRVAGQTDLLGGNYRVSHNLDLRLLSGAEAMDYALPVDHIVHLLEPQDNGFIFEERISSICRGTGFSWAAPPDVVSYRFKLDIYRDLDHPNGYGFEASVLNFLLSDTSYKPELPELPELTHFELEIRGYNGSGAELAYIMRSFWANGGVGYGGDYRFKVCPSCVRGDINRDCVVNMLDFAILAAEWLTNTK
jgi:hypothetical protein